MISRIITFIIILHLCLPVSMVAAGEYTLYRHHSGKITIHNNLSQDDQSLFVMEHSLSPLLSQVGTGLSLFTTSVLYATGYDEDHLIEDLYKHVTIDHISGNTGSGIYAGEMLLLLGTLSASLFNYSFGFNNDLLAVIPIFPVEVSAEGTTSTYGKSEQQIRLQFGIYFYFSRDF